MARKRKNRSPKFEGRIHNWALWYLRRHHWRIAAMCDHEDLEQEAYLLYLKVCRRHPEITDEEEFLKLFKTSMRFRLRTLAAACVPNPYDASVGAQVVSESNTNEHDFIGLVDDVVFSVRGDFGDCIDLVRALPDDLRDLGDALLSEVVGERMLPSRLRPRLHRRWTTESLNKTLRRLFGESEGRVDDLLEEMAAALR